MKKTKVPSLIPVLILTLITVVMWVSLDIYRAVKKPVESTVPPEISKPLTPTLDQDLINQLESRNLVDDSQIPDIVVGSSPTPKPEATPKTIATPKPTEIPIEILTDNSTNSGTTQ